MPITSNPIVGNENGAADPAGDKPPMVLHPRVITGAGGGPDKTVLNSPRFLREHGYESACLFYRPPNDEGFQAIRDRAADWGAPIHEIDDNGPLDWKIVPKTIELCRRLNVAVWHAHDYKTNLLGLLVRRRWPMRLVTTVHGWVELTPKTRIYHWLDRWTLPRYERVLCVSADLRDRCLEYGVRSEQATLIENAIDTEQFRRRLSPAEAKSKLGLPPDELLIGAVGRLSPEKGFDLLIRAFAAMPASTPRARLAILGDGVERASLQSQIDSSGLADRVTLAGFQSNTIDWYQAMDVFALSSLREGLPNVVLEAMALETPIVATRVAGVPRVIDDKRNGLVVPIDDEGALSGALTSLVVDPALRERLATEARRVIEDRYSFAARMRKVVDLYASLRVTT